MKKNLEKLQIILLTVLCCLVGRAVVADTKVNGFIMPYSSIPNEHKSVLLDTNIRIRNNLDDRFGLGFSVSPIQLRPEKNHWNPLPEYYLSIKDKRFGKISIGQYNSNNLLVDGRSFSVGEYLGETEHSSFYNPLLTDILGRRQYDFKFGYLSPLIEEKFYFSSSYIPKKNTSEIRFFYGDTINASTDFKSSVSFINRKISAGFNLQYLGFIVGGSMGEKLYTGGIGYSIGALRTTLTYLKYQEEKSLLLGGEYKLKKDLTSFLYINSLTDNHKSVSIILGVKISIN
jgi:hypothetical protein